MNNQCLGVIFWLFFGATVLAQTGPPAASKGGSLQSNSAMANSPREIAALVKAALENGAGSKLLSEYTYTLRILERRPGRNGLVKETFELYEAYIPTLKNKSQTRSVLIALTKDGVRLAEKQLEKDRLKAAERLLKAEEETQKYNEKQVPGGETGADEARGAYFELKLGGLFVSDFRLDIKTVLRQADFTAPRQAQLAGRAVIALEFQMPKSAQLEKDERYLAGIVGTVWIDATEKMLLRAEGWPPADSVRTGRPVFLYEQMQLPDGYWLPRQVQLNGDAQRAIFGRLGVDYTFEFSDYKRFSAETQDVKLLAPTRKP